MSKTVNTDLKFTTDTSTSTGTTTTGTSTSYTLSSFWCKYYLPCGKCDKTGELCTHYAPPQPVYPYYPSWWSYHPWWTEPYYTTTPWTCGSNDNNIKNK